MNKIANKFLSAWDSAISASGVRFLKIPAARREINRLGMECAKAGQPQKSWSGVNLTRANQEIDRLRQVIASAGATNLSSGAVASAMPPGSPQPVVVDANAAASSSFMKTKVAQPEQVAVKIAHRTPTPQPAASASITARRARVFGAWNVVPRNISAEVLTQRPVVGVQLTAADGLEPRDLELSQHNQAAGERVNRAYLAKIQAQHAKDNSADAMLQDINVILEAAMAKGLRIPGESFKGLTVNPNARPLPQPEREKAQAMINEFCAVLDGDESAAISGSLSSRSAIRFMEKQTGKTFTIGTTFTPRS